MKQLAKYLVAIGAGLVLIGNAGVAQAAPNPDRVCQPQGEHRWPGHDVKSVTVDAPEGKIITGYCVKAGSINNGYGPEYVDGLSDESVTITHSSGKDISHYVVFYDDKPEPPPTTLPPVVVDPTATLSIECLVDSDYEVKFGIEAGSEDAEYILRLRGGNGMLTDGTVAAEGDYSEAVTATLDEGMIVVLRINGERIKSVMVPAACPEPVEPPTTTVPPVEPPVEPPTTTVPPVEPPVEPPVTTVPPVEPPVTTVPPVEPPVEVPVSLGPAQPAEEPAQSLPDTGAGSVIFYLGLICLGFGLPLWALGRLIRK